MTLVATRKPSWPWLCPSHRLPEAGPPSRCMALDREGRRQRLDPGLRGDRLKGVVHSYTEPGFIPEHGSRTINGVPHSQRSHWEWLGCIRLHLVPYMEFLGVSERSGLRQPWRVTTIPSPLI